MSSKGSLIIAGSGIACIEHVTLGAIECIKNADIVYYLVNDSIVVDKIVTENLPNGSKAYDLSVLYEVNTFRYETYIKMAEFMLRAVRENLKVVGFFYGHPGFFVSPSHRALKIARDEGYEARMLPGISAVDYLIADLEVEPARYGLMIHEANDLLVRNRHINPWAHNVILQVGGVGDTTAGITNSKYGFLVDQLEFCFGPDHEMVVYVGAVTQEESGSATSPGKRYPISKLRDLGSSIGMDATFYIPPVYIPPVHRTMVQVLGFDAQSIAMMKRVPEWVDTRWITKPGNGPFEQEVINNMMDGLQPQLNPVGGENGGGAGTLSTIGVAI